MNRADVIQKETVNPRPLGRLNVLGTRQTGLNHLDSKVGTFQLKNVAIYPNMGRIKCLKRHTISHPLLTMDYSKRLLDSLAESLAESLRLSGGVSQTLWRSLSDSLEESLHLQNRRNGNLRLALPKKVFADRVKAKVGGKKLGR